RLCGGALIVSRYSRTISSQVSLFVKRPHIVKTHAHADPTGDDDKLRTQCGRSRKAVGGNRTGQVLCRAQSCENQQVLDCSTTFTLRWCMNRRRLETLACLLTVALGMPVSCATNKPEMAWVRTDGKRIGNDPDLLKQGQTDIAICNANLDAGAIDQGGRDCMAEKGYALVRKEQAEQARAGYEASAPQPPKTPSAADR